MKSKIPPKKNAIRQLHDYSLEQLNQLLCFILPVVRNSIFLILWILLQHLVQETIDGVDFNHSNKLKFLFSGLRIVFGLSTFLPILISLYRDSWVMWSQAYRAIQQEKQRSLR